MAMAGNAQAGVSQADTVQPEAAPTETAELPMEEQPIFAAGALDSLLPQDAVKEQQAAQNQQLMDMLSSENGAGARLTNQTLPEFSTEVREVVIPAEGTAQQE